MGNLSHVLALPSSGLRSAALSGVLGRQALIRPTLVGLAAVGAVVVTFAAYLLVAQPGEPSGSPAFGAARTNLESSEAMWPENATAVARR